MKLSKLWLGLSSVFALNAVALSQVLDWPVARHNQERTGINGDRAAGPGFANLNWWWPRNADLAKGVTLDIDSQTPPAGVSVIGSTWSFPTTKLQATGYYGTGGYLISSCVASNNPDDPTSGATARVVWTLTPPASSSGQYALYVQFPTSGTTVNGVIMPNALHAVYRVRWTYAGATHQAIYRIQHTSGGEFVRVGINALFPADSSNPIEITLYNTVPVVEDINGNVIPEEDPGKVIVCADAAAITISPASAQSSPIVVRKNGVPRVYLTENLGVVDPNDDTGSKLAQTGEVVCVVPPNAPNPAYPLWRWTPSQQSNVNIVLDDKSLRQDGTWLPTDPPPAGTPDWYGTGAVQHPVTDVASETSARWDPKLSAKESFDIYAWFPSVHGTVANTRHARYVVHYYDGSGMTTDTVDDIDQTLGGRWVKIGKRSYPNDPDSGQVYVEVLSSSADASDLGRVVQADALMFVGEYQSGITVSPGHYTVNVKQKDGATVPTEVLFVADQSGHVYMLDANGDGTGRTWAYWAYPSVPDVNDKTWKDPNVNQDAGAPPVGAFIRTSVVVGKVRNKDAVFIGSTNGRIYALDIEGRGDYDANTQKSGTTKRHWTYPDTVPDVSLSQVKNYNAVVAGTPAYHNNVVYMPTTEGRVYALDCDGDGDGTTTEKWIYPRRSLDGLTEEKPVGAIQGSVTFVDDGSAGTIVFGTGSFSQLPGMAPSGQIYALNAQGIGNRQTTTKWLYPGIGTPIGGITYGGALYVPQIAVDGTNLIDAIYIGADDGKVYCFDVTKGKLMWTSKALGGAVRSAPTWAMVIPSDGTTSTPQECVAVTTAAGEAFALLAKDSAAGAAGKGIWGIQTTDSTEIFGSLAVVGNFMYGLTNGGRLLVFSNTSAGNGYDDPGFNPVQIIEAPDSNGTNSDVAGTIVKRISKDDYDKLRNLDPNDTTPPMTPYTAQPINNQVLEWGEVVYLVAYNFHTGASGSVTFQLKGPSTTPRGAGSIKTFKAGASQKDGFSIYAYTIEGTRTAPFTPGDKYWFEAMVRTDSNANVGPFLAQPQPLTIANPICLITVDPATVANLYNTQPPGTVGLINDRTLVSTETTMNGSFDNLGKPKTLIVNQSPNGYWNNASPVSHGQIGRGTFWVVDRSLLQFSTGRGLRFIMGGRQDLGFSGGAAAMIKPLPWDIAPVGSPNPSPDYPDIDRRHMSMWGDQPLSPKNLVLDNANLPGPIAGTEVDYGDRRFSVMTTKVETQVPIYQPANMSAGYNNTVWIWADVDGDRRPTGVSIDGSPTGVDNNVPPPGAEPYRTLSTRLFIPPDEKITISEPTVDLGEMAAGTGMTPEYPRANGSKFFPSKWLAGQPNTYDSFFKPFTVYSYSNVNMINLRLASQLNAVQSGGPQPRNSLSPVAFYGDGLSEWGWLGADLSMVSNLDPRWAAKVSLHKPRPGDRAPTSLRLPDAPYGVQTPNALPPTVGVAVPIGQPSGSYTQYIRVFEDLYGTPNVALDYVPSTGKGMETFTEPTMKVKFLVRESRLTNGIDPGVLGMFDAASGYNVFRTGNGAPAAYRDKNGNLITVFASERKTATNTVGAGTPLGAWTLFSGSLSATGQLPRTSLAEPLLDLFKWKANNNARWWQLGSGPYPTNGASLFTGVNGTVVPGTLQFFEPSFPTNINDMKTPYVFWQGQVDKQSQGRRQTEYGIFYAKVSPQDGKLDTPIRMQTTNANVPDAGDTEMPRSRPIATGDATGGGKLFWYGSTTGRNGLFVNETTNLAGGKWGVSRSINTSAALSSVRDPYPVPKLNGEYDLIYCGTAKDRNTNEIFLSTYTYSNGGVDWSRMKSQGSVTENAMLDNRVGNLWRTKGLDWIIRPGPGGGFDIKVNNRSILVNPVFDRDNTVLRYESSLGGYVIVDPVAGTVQFPSMGPGPHDVVSVTYNPRTFRMTSLGNAGGHTEPVAFIDRRPAPDVTYSFRSSGKAAQKGDYIPMDRYWLLYKRGGTNAGQLSALYMQTFRPGVQLPTAIAAGTSVSITPMPGSGKLEGFYTVDYSRGKIYFTQLDVGKSLSIRYTLPPGTPPQPQNRSYTVAWIPEMDETAVPNQRGLAESQVSAFADPGIDVTGRPGFIWLFWNSTRNGASDVYFQTISPRFDVIPATGTP